MAVKTVLKVVQETAYRMGVSAPSSLFGNSTKDGLKWLHLFYETGEDIRNQFDYPTLKKRYTFDTVVGQKFYPLPGDFWRLLLNTQWDNDNQWALQGPASDGEMVYRDLGIAENNNVISFRLAGAPFQNVTADSFDVNSGYFEISPTPTDVRTLTIEYLSGNWFYPAQYANGAYTSGDLLTSAGNIYKATSTGTATAAPTGESTTIGETGISFQKWRGLYNQIQSDDDIPVIDPETIKHSLTAKWQRSKGLDSAEASQLAAQSIKRAVGRFEAPVMVSGLGGHDIYPWLNNDFITTGW